MLSRERYTVIGVLILAAIVSMPLAHGFTWLFVRMGWANAMIVGREVQLTTLLAYSVGAAGAMFCLYHRPTRQLVSEVVEELAKVTWPTRAETGSATVVVIATVLLCSVYLGVFDALWLWLTDKILGVTNG